MSNRLKIGQRIRDQREALGYTREELAELVNITPRFCYDLELGNKGMSVETLCLLSEKLNISTDYILFGADADNNNEDMQIMISLIHTCPKDKCSHLKNIISCYLQAIR